MIFAHLIVGAMPIEEKFSIFWFLGSILPDVDHVFIIIRHKFFSLKKIVKSFAHEERYGILYKTKYLHSIFGGLCFSLLAFFLFNYHSALYFFLGYMGHLILDLPDRDYKQYFFPFKVRFKGWMPILSKTEIIFTIVILIILIKIYV